MRPRAARAACAGWRPCAAPWPRAERRFCSFETAGDRAEETLLPSPAAGGFLRGNFVKENPAVRAISDAYDVQRKLGAGAFGAVYAATHRGSGQVVAVKTVAKRGSSADVAAVQAEVSFLKSTDHPNVARLYESFEDESNLYLVMEYCSGGELWSSILSAHEAGLGYGEQELAQAMQQLLRALAYCHEHGIVHRDIKPQNFLYASAEQDAALKLVDFGVSGVVTRADDDTCEKRLLTRTVGTNGFIAPEVLMSRPYGTPADVFSVGATMHAAVVGLPPRWCVDRGDPAYVFPGKMRWRMLSPEAQDLLKRLVEPDPAARPSAAEALHSPWFDRCESAKGCFLDESYLRRMRRFGRRSKIQQCARASVMALSSLLGEEAAAMRRAFLAADADESGEVSAEDLASAIAASGAKVDVKEIFACVDTSHTGFICFSEWMAATASDALFASSGGARRAFDALDGDRDGIISAADLEAALPGVMARSDILQEIRRFDDDGSGGLDFDEFCKLLREGIE